jgi:Smg protein
MRERIFSIIEIIVRQILMSRNLVHDEKEIVEYLISEGYNLEEINTAFSLIKDIAGEQKVKTPLRKSLNETNNIRILSNDEKISLTREAYGFLIRLKGLGFIDNELQEEIIERAQYFTDGEVGLDEIKSIAALVMINRSGTEWGDDINRLFNDEWESALN